MNPSAPAQLYEGSVRHRRFAVRPRCFEHRLALFYLDLERADEVLGGNRRVPPRDDPFSSSGLPG